MKKLMDVLPLLLVVVLLFGTACQSNKKKDAESVNVTLFDKDLPEIKTLVNGEWELVSGKNAREFCEYENTFIKFADDQYVWTEDGKAEPELIDMTQEKKIELDAADYVSGRYKLYVGAVLEDGSVSWGEALFELMAYVEPTAEPTLTPTAEPTLAPTA